MKLHEYIESCINMPFCWGKHDCCTFTIGWLNIVSGKDWLADHRPWNSAASANRILKKLGGLDHLFNSNLVKIHPNFACDGDLTIADGTACLFSGGSCVSAGETGLVFIDRSMAKEAWVCRF